MVLTVPLGYKLPTSLANDVVTQVVPLPDETAIGEIADSLIRDAGLSPMTTDAKAASVSALAGLSGFAAEQAFALSLSKQGVDAAVLWERKRRLIEQTPGLSVWRGRETFKDVGGCNNAKRFFSQLIAGNRKPRCVVFLDEIEKALAGSGGSDTSSVSQGMLGALLTFMQDEEATGSIFIGPPGAAKSAVAKAVGAEAGCPTIAYDLGGMKASLVGESEARMRGSLQTCKAVGQGQILFLATCNSIGVLPPELRRRFTLGTFFFDLPTAEERFWIWPIWCKKYGLQTADLPDDEGWTGAEIRQCCDVADRLGVTLREAAGYVVPVSRSAADKIEELRKMASGKFLSAAYAGVYKYEKTAPEGRRVEV